MAVRMTAVLIYADPYRSMDLFHAVPAAIIDPFLYLEADGRRVAVLPEHDHASIAAVDDGIELVDFFVYGRKELLQSGMSYVEAGLEVARRACADHGVRAATVNWDFPVALADRLRADGVGLTVDAGAFERRRRGKTCPQPDRLPPPPPPAGPAMGGGGPPAPGGRGGPPPQ